LLSYGTQDPVEIKIKRKKRVGEVPLAMGDFSRWREVWRVLPLVPEFFAPEERCNFLGRSGL